MLNLPPRFWSKVISTKKNDCHEWIGSCVGGYGSFRLNGKIQKAHRLAYQNKIGDIPTGMIVMHTCDNRACVNVNHLRLGTVLDNNRDRDEKGRHIALRGESHGMSKLIRCGVLEIKKLQRAHAKEINQLAKRLGIAKTTIRDVMNGRTWNWLK